MYTKMSNSVSDSLEKCRNAFRLIVEGEVEEDYLEKASRGNQEATSDDGIAMDPDPNIDAVEQLDHPGLALLTSACHRCVEEYESSGRVENGDITIDNIEEADGEHVETLILTLTVRGEDMSGQFISDVEKVLEGKYEFAIIGMKSENDNGFKVASYVYQVTSTDTLNESETGPMFVQKKIRPRKPIQIKKAGRCVRNNKFMRKNFRRKYFAKRGLLFKAK